MLNVERRVVCIRCRGECRCAGPELAEDLWGVMDGWHSVPFVTMRTIKLGLDLTVGDVAAGVLRQAERDARRKASGE